MHLPLTTPFHPDGRLNLRKLEQNVARYSLTPAAGMVVLGATGEANLLTDAEVREMLGHAIAAAAPTKVMLAGVACQGVIPTLERIELAASLGYDAVLVGPPVFAGVSAVERRVYLERVVDASALPVVLTGDLPLDLVADLAFHPQVLGLLQNFASEADLRLLLGMAAGVKRTVTVTTFFAAVTGRMAQSTLEAGTAMVSAATLGGGGAAVAVAPAKPVIRTRTKEVGFQILVAGTEQMLSGLQAGAVGAVPPFAIAAPQACYEVMAAWKDGDPALAAEKQLRVVEAGRKVEGEFGVTGLKYGCDLNGYFGGLPRLPLLPLLGEQKAEVERLMQGMRS